MSAPLMPQHRRREGVGAGANGSHRDAGALDEAEQQILAVQGDLPDPSLLVIAVAALPSGVGRGDWARLSAVAHAGTAARVHPCLRLSPIASARRTCATARPHNQCDRSGKRLVPDVRAARSPPSVGDRSGIPAPLALDASASEDLVAQVCARSAATAAAARRTDFSPLMPARIWQGSATDELRAVVGRDGRQPFELALNDATRTGCSAGRSGTSKTNVLLITLYALVSRYSPDELGLYRLEFKEGVSFVELTPTRADLSWVPHARTVGIESDREYGVAVLRALSREINRRAGVLKTAGVTNSPTCVPTTPAGPTRGLATHPVHQARFGPVAVWKCPIAPTCHEGRWNGT